MALSSQNVPIALSQGIDTKDDQKQLQPGKMLVLQNASFKSPGQIQKRDGFNSLTQTIFNGSTITNGIGIGSFQNELLSLDGSNLYSYSPDVAGHINRGPLVPTQLSVSTVVRNTNKQTGCDSAYDFVSGLFCYTYNDTTSGGVNCTVIDSTTGATIINEALVSATAIKAKVLDLNPFFVIIYMESGNTILKYVTINTTNPTGVSSYGTIDTNIVNDVFDAIVVNGQICLVYNKAAGMTFNTMTSGLVVGTPYSISITATTVYAVTLQSDASYNLWAAYWVVDSSNKRGIRACIAGPAVNSTVLADTLVVNHASSDAQMRYNLTMSISGTTATIYSEDNAVASLVNLNKITLTIGGTPGTNTLVNSQLGLASKVFTYNGVDYLLGIYAGSVLPTSNAAILAPTSQEPTYFLINGNNQVILKLAPSNAGSFYRTGLLPAFISLSATNFEIPYLFQDDLSALNGVVYYNTGINSAQINFALTNPMPKLVMGNNLLFGSGQLWAYDGATVCEQGFHLYPENLSPSASVSGGAIGYPSANYNPGGPNQVQYVAIYEWSDKQGQLHRSAVSPALTVQLPQQSTITPYTFTATSTINSAFMSSVVVTSGAIYPGQIYADTTSGHSGMFPAGTYVVSYNSSTAVIQMSNPATVGYAGDIFTTYDTCSIQVSIPTLTVTAKPNVSIVLYRTLLNQTVFYRASSLTSLTYNSTAAQVVITDTIADDILLGNEQLYTTGGTIDNINCPAVSAIVSFKERAVCLTPENPFQFNYSQQLINGVPLEFNALFFTENIDQKIGKATAIGPLDDKLILFGPSRKFYVVGSGPSPNGTNNDFTDSTPIAGVSGCSNPISVLELPVGLMYQDAEKGFWLLDRSLQEHYIGDAVEAFNGYTVTSAVLFPNSTKAMYTLTSGANLIYDYYVHQWEVDYFYNAAADSTLFENDVTYINPAGLVLQQTPNVFSDNGSVIPFSLTTGWMSLAGIQGYQRVWELVILGTYKTPHTLTVNIFTDYSNTATTTKVIPVLSNPGLYQFRVRPNVQKCETIQIQIIESQSGSPGEGLALSNLALRVGIKGGMNKLPTGQSY